MAREILKIMTYVDGENDLPFPSAEGQIGITEYTYSSQRMGGVTLSAKLMYRECLDRKWTGLQYVEFRGEKYFISATPSSGKDNEDARYEHTLSFIPERDLKLNNVYFYDAVSKESTGDDKYKSNSTQVVFFGDIHEFVARLNESLKYSGLDYSVVIDTGITSEAKLMSFEDQFFFSVLQEIYNVYELPFYFTGKVIHIGFTSNAITQTFKYGFDNELLSIKKNNANYRIINRCTGTGSEDNIPYYYPNLSPKGDITAEAGAGNTGIRQQDIRITDYQKFAAAMDLNDSVRYIKLSVSEIRYSQYGNQAWFDDIQDVKYSFVSHINFMSKEKMYVTAKVARPGIIEFPLNFSIKRDSTIPVYVTHSFKCDVTSADDTIRFYDETGAMFSSGDSGFVPLELKGMERRDILYIKTSKAGTLRFVVTVNITLSVSAGYSWDFMKPDLSYEYYMNGLTFDNGIEPYGNGVWISGEDENGYITEASLDDLGLSVTGTPSDGDTITQVVQQYITPSKYLMPPIYRESLGAERFYNALNDTYTDPDTGKKYIFENEYDPEVPREHKQEFEDIKPTIKGMTNAAGQRMDQILDIAFDEGDSDEVDEEGNYLHPYFFVKLPKYNGDYGFNLFDHAIDEEEMSISMTSGQCGACEFIIGVSDDDAQKNLVQVDSYGNLLRDSNGNVRCGREGMAEEKPQDRQNDTVNYEVWIALKKEESTYGQLMPNVQQNLKPAKGDSFVILHIDLPQAYILNAENELKEAIVKYMSENNSEKFNFSIVFSRIYLEEHPDIETQLNENARIQLEYDGVKYELYISQYTYKCLDDEALPEISVEITDTITVNRSVLQNTADSIMNDVRSSIGRIDFLTQGITYFLRKDVDDVALGRIAFRRGVHFGTYTSGMAGAGGAVTIDADNLSHAEFDFLTVRRKAVFKELTVEEMTHAGGQIIISPASMVCSSVEDTGDAYRCFFETTDADGASVYNQFSPGDQARCQTFNMWGNRYYWRLVTGTGPDYIDLSKTDADTGSDIPEAGDRIVQLGCRNDTSRQAAQIISCFGENSPSYVMYNGIDSFTLVGKNITGIIFNQNSRAPQMYSYGEMFFGDRDLDDPDANYITFQQREGDDRKKLFIKAEVQLGAGSSGLDNLEEWKDVNQDIEDLANAATEAADAIKKAQETADAVTEKVEGWVADGVISPLEKQGLKDELARIASDYKDVNSGYSKYGLGNPTDYNAAYVDYRSDLLTLTADEPENVPVPPGFEATQQDYYTKWSAALEAIAAAAKDAVNQAQNDANNAQQTANDALQKATEAKDYIDNTLPEEIANINKKLDGVVETWFYPYSPTLSNEPAATWIKDGEQEKHIGDMFLNNQEYVDETTTPDAGKAWRWEKDTSGGYFWNQVADSDAVKALQDAAKAQDTADQKRRVFVTTPYPPYDVGDMWAQGASGDIMRCIKARATGSYSASDWEKASKYTDDAVAQDALSKAGAAQDAADAAQDAADAAQAAASKAQGTAENAVADASEANKQLANLMSDNVITPPEKTALKQQHSDIKTEYSQIIADAQKYGVSTTAYTNAYNSADAALTKYTAASPENISVGSDYSNISAYYTARQTILDAIATAAKKVADDAQHTADAAQDAADNAQSTAISAAASASQAIKDAAAAQSAIQSVRGDLNNLSDDVTDLDEYLDGAFRDGVINDAEAISIKKYINTVNESWTDLQASYNVVYNNANLSGTPKTNLKSAYDTLSTRKNTLITSINTAVSNPSTTNVTAVDTAFTNYNSAVSIFKTALENATKSIEDAIRTAANNAAAAAQQAQSAATSAANAAANAQADATAASTRLDNWASDSYISPTEKPAIKDEITRIAYDYNQIHDGCEEYGLGTPTDYDEAYDSYRKQLVSLSASTPENISIPSSFRSNQEAYYNRRAAWLNNISAAAKTVVDNMSIGVTNIVQDGKLNISSSTAYLVATIRLHKKLVSGQTYTAVMSGQARGTNVLRLFESWSMTTQGSFVLKSGRIYTATFKYTRYVDPENSANQSADTKLKIYNQPQASAASNPADIDWICIYEGDVKAPDIFMEAPEDMLAGGINLALRTNQGTTGWSWSMQTGGYTAAEVTEDGIRCCKLTRDTVAQSGWSVIMYGNSYINRSKYKGGKMYTVSFEVKSSVASTFNVSFKDSDSSDTMELKTEYRNNSAAANTWTKIVAVLTMKDTLPTSTSQVLYLTGMASGTGVSHTFRNLMIEEGSIPTPWKAAPEDTDAAIEAVNESVENLRNFTDEAFADGIVDRAEAASIEKYINQINESFNGLIASYNVLNSNPNLTGTAKSNLQSAYSTLSTRKSTLISAINTAIADGVTSASEKNNVNTAFNNYNDAVGTFSQRLDQANQAIQDAIRDSVGDVEGRLSDIEYLHDVFPNNTVESGAVIAEMAVVKDSGKNIVAGINGTDIGSDSTHGKALMFAGTGSTGELDDKISAAATRIYEDGTIDTSKLIARDGELSGNLTVSGMYVVLLSNGSDIASSSGYIDSSKYCNIELDSLESFSISSTAPIGTVLKLYFMPIITRLPAGSNYISGGFVDLNQANPTTNYTIYHNLSCDQPGRGGYVELLRVNNSSYKWVLISKTDYIHIS